MKLGRGMGAVGVVGIWCGAVACGCTAARTTARVEVAVSGTADGPAKITVSDAAGAATLSATIPTLPGAADVEVADGDSVAVHFPNGVGAVAPDTVVYGVAPGDRIVLHTIWPAWTPGTLDPPTEVAFISDPSAADATVVIRAFDQQQLTPADGHVATLDIPMAASAFPIVIASTSAGRVVDYAVATGRHASTAYASDYLAPVALPVRLFNTGALTVTSLESAAVAGGFATRYATETWGTSIPMVPTPWIDQVAAVNLATADPMPGAVWFAVGGVPSMLVGDVAAAPAMPSAATVSGNTVSWTADATGPAPLGYCIVTATGRIYAPADARSVVWPQQLGTPTAGTVFAYQDDLVADYAAWEASLGLWAPAPGEQVTIVESPGGTLRVDDVLAYH